MPSGGLLGLPVAPAPSANIRARAGRRQCRIHAPAEPHWSENDAVGILAAQGRLRRAPAVGKPAVGVCGSA